MKALRSLVFFTNTLLMYLGLPLLGWGVRHWRAFFAASQRLGYAGVVAVFGLAVGWEAYDAPEGLRGARGREDKLVSRQSIVRVIVTLAFFAALYLLPLADRRNLGSLGDLPAVRWVGLALFTVGFGFIFWSGVALGRLYSAEVTLQEEHHLVTEGLYRHIRHPRYAGGILLSFGLSCLFDVWIGLVLSVVIIGIFLLRIKDEEALMEEAFGQAWRDYCAQTDRLIPFVY
jgi:protein-S-isoprenylcysteine O-methyltransferase Ste14